MNISKNEFLHSETGSFLLKCVEFVQALFPILLITLLLLSLIETVFEGSVSSYLNLDALLVIVILVSTISLASAPAETEQSRYLTAKNVLMMVSAGIGGAVIIWYKTQEIGWLSYIVSVVGGGLITLLPVLIWRESEGEDEEENS